VVRFEPIAARRRLLHHSGSDDWSAKGTPYCATNRTSKIRGQCFPVSKKVWRPGM
jgi:hypothetical protein